MHTCPAAQQVWFGQNSVLWHPLQPAVGASLMQPLHHPQSGLLELEGVLVPCREGSLAAPGEWGQGSHAKPDWEAASMPSDRVWLGNITASATVHSVRVVFSQFGGAYARPVCLLGSAGRRIGQPLSNSI